MQTLPFVLSLSGAVGTSLGAWLVTRAHAARAIAEARAEAAEAVRAREASERALKAFSERFELGTASAQGPDRVVADWCASQQLAAAALGDREGLVFAHAGDLSLAAELAALTPWVLPLVRNAPRARVLLRAAGGGEALFRGVRVGAQDLALAAVHPHGSVGGYALERALFALGEPETELAHARGPAHVPAPAAVAEHALAPRPTLQDGVLEALSARVGAQALELAGHGATGLAPALAELRATTPALAALLVRAERVGLVSVGWCELADERRTIALLPAPQSFSEEEPHASVGPLGLWLPRGRLAAFEAQRIEGLWARWVRALSSPQVGARAA